ncbi:hypothetical protein PLICRDRAFT_140356 [Plicaturopsis crispa FD-325 SS-3]|nr:hypothetical protein PLICRDRAFT_140356 [Plicaturopsis crispa FD-325 SS-3]
MATELQLSDEHPLVLELSSLRLAVERFQHESHAASVKLQRHSLDTSHSFERAQVLERENARLREEVALLRAHPEITPHPAVLQVQELTLGLRRVSDKLDLTEEALRVRTTELAAALSEVTKAKHDVESAYELASRIRGREEEGKVIQRELERKARAAEEERKMADLVVQEYADLVRSLEGRPSSNVTAHPRDASGSSSSTTLVDGLAEGKTGLQKLLEEFNAETEKLEAEIVRLHGELATSEAKREAERKGAEHDRSQLGKALVELEKLKVDDQTAAKIVSRYMKFSQSSTDALQKAMDAQKSRHSATIATLSTQVDSLKKSFTSERRQADKLRHALDELAEDLAREAYGRRREVSLRLAFVGREESIAEGLRRWSRKAKELLERSTSSEEGDVAAAFEQALREADVLLLALNGNNLSDGNTAGALARVLTAQNAVANLTNELQEEVQRRIRLERKLGQLEAGGLQTPASAALPIHMPPKAKELPPIARTVVAQEKADDVPVASSPIAPRPPSPSREPSTDREDAIIPASHDVSTENTLPLTTPISAMEEPPIASPDTADKMNAQVLVSPIDVIHQPSPRVPETPTLLVELTTSPTLPVVETMSESRPSTSSITFPSEQQSSTPVASSSVLEEDASLSPSTPPAETATTPTDSAMDTSELLASLAQVRHRYDDLQRSFRDCHLALKDIKKTLTEPLLPSENSAILQTAVERLNDYNEDARVELEIRVADEELAMRGFETLLAVPGAISDEKEHAEVESEIKRFIDGSEKGVSKALQQFTRKLDDLQHDIASIKRSLHELPSPEIPRPTTPKTPPGWSQWTAGLLGSSQRPTSASPAPTFGSVMTTAPRLRHSPSFTQSRRPSVTVDSNSPDPFSSLGLRVPMPSHVTSSHSQNAGPSIRTGVRARTTSAMYMLGLGARSTSLNQTPPKPRAPVPIAAAESDTDAETDEGSQTDVE